VDQILADESVYLLTSAGDVLWPLTDHLNTTRDLAEYNSGTDTASIASHRVFDSFGNLISETNGSVTILLGFTARPLDVASGLQWNLNRWYISTLGVWMSEDPIGFAAGDANVARYISNQPLSDTDPTGLAPLLYDVYNPDDHGYQSPLGMEYVLPEGSSFTSDYGSIVFPIRWLVPPNSNGWIIQHINATSTVTDCEGKTKTQRFEYWEAWEVVDGVVYLGKKHFNGDNRGGLDYYDHPGGKAGTKGSLVVVGLAKFIPTEDLGDIDPSSWEGVEQAGILKATSTKPKGWTEMGAIAHNLSLEWDDCSVPKVKSRLIERSVPVPPAHSVR
jgi:RHS repeat-associated protein